MVSLLPSLQLCIVCVTKGWKAYNKIFWIYLLKNMLQIKYYPGEGYNFQYMPDYRFYCDEKILRPLSSYYDYPFPTRIWVPYGKLRVYTNYLPFRGPFREQRIRRVLYNIPQTLEPCYPYNL
ncbi:unnamed protein product [Acanthoscelides obtectus]|uniref:Uncharacterized protein n=1 Tax=Acanthoscelides obtectus TaxID=200917 RepID=A0A9P0KHM2_ACAOB|nr:unnamed protein product [Acanthoscelides obtectus]CAK1681654.1 hypothetical protein AOBTE_LOCUS33193 [Acanthoscelides obtectus]